MDRVEVLKNLIANEWIESSSGRTFENENPARRGSVINLAQASAPEDVEHAVAAAADAFAAWSRTPLNERQRVVGEFLRLLSEAREELATVVSTENGKTIREARAEVDAALAEGHHHWHQVSAFSSQGPHCFRADVTAWEQYHPLGVVAVISPWNYPVNVMCRKTLPALLTGNTVVFKPASFTPWSGVFMAGLFERAGLPPGVFNCVTGSGGGLGNALVEDERVRAVSFTGSTAVGKKIQAMAAGRLIRTQLELGGKNALIVMGDADLAAAVDATILAGFGCAGQWCTSTSRVLLQADIADDYLQRLRSRCEALSVGDPLDETTDMGPVAGPTQFASISAAIERAAEQGARMLWGGAAPPEWGGYFVEPTVFDEVSPGMSVFQEEIFGPVLAVTRFTDLHEAIQLANTSDRGLSSSIFTKDLGTARHYIEQIEAGLAHVNVHTGFKVPALPFGGWKESGFGPPENGRTGLEFFVERKAVYLKAD